MKIFHQCTCGAQVSAEWDGSKETFFTTTFKEMFAGWLKEHKECIIAPRKLEEQQKIIDKIVRSPIGGKRE